MEKLKINDFTGYSFLSQLKYAPDGKRLSFQVKEANMEENDYNSYLWIYNFASESYFKLTTAGKAGQYLWLDSENILFVSKRERRKKSKEKKDKKVETKLYKINIHGGEAEFFATLPFALTEMKRGGDDLLWLTAVSDLSKPDGGEKDKKEADDAKDYKVLEEIPFWSNGKGFTDHKRNHFYRFDLHKKETEKVVGGNYDVNNFDIKNGRVVLNMSEFVDKFDLYSDLYLYDPEEKDLTKLTSAELSISFVNFKDKNTIIYAASDMKASGANTNREIYKYDLQEGQSQQLTEMDKSLWTSVGSDSRLGGGYNQRLKDGQLYFLSTEEYSTYLNILEDGKVKRVIDREGSIDSFDIHQDRIVFIGFRANRLQELYLYQDGQEQRLTDFNSEVVEQKRLSQPEHFTVTTSDDCRLDAWIMKPVDFDSTKKYPTILEIHGGPKTVYGTIFFHEMQVLANQGYAVVFTNPRGSDGRGNQFADIRGKYGTRDYQDLMETLDEAIAKFDFIDEDRLGVAGGSYGGYMTNWVIGHTDRFKAAVSQRSISNWISKFGTTDIGYFFVEDQSGGATPWNGFDQLWDSSPLKYADQVTTPTLFIHSEEDYRCWLPEGIQMFTALKYHGVESRMVIFKGENHELSRSGKPKHRIRRLEEMIGWFNKYLKNN